MDRRAQMFEILRISFEEKIKNKGIEISSKVEKNEDKIKEVFLNKIDTLFKKALSENKEIKYLLISPLNTSILTNSYEIMISIYTDAFYLQKEEYIEYLKIPFIFENIDYEMEEFKKILESRFTKIKEYEVKELKYKYVRGHNILVMIFISHFLNYVSELENFREIKENMLKALYGEYMDRSIELIDYKEGE